MFPTRLLPYTTMQFGRVFPKEKKKLNICENEHIYGVSGFRLEMSTIYLGVNIENVTFKINKIKTLIKEM